MKQFKIFIPASIISLLIIISVTVHYKSYLALYYVIILGALEIALSFDNAVVNAKVLANMSHFWRMMFLWIGLPIAVFGMRLVFPILLVYWSSELNFHQVIKLAIHDTQGYSEALHIAMPAIIGFGACFLFMVFISFLFEYTKPHKNQSNQKPSAEDAFRHEIYWIKIIENNKFIKTMKKHIWSSALIGVITCSIIWLIGLKVFNNNTIGKSATLGLIVHQVLYALNQTLNKYSNNKTHANKTLARGLIGFCYLEVLDATFSLDGVLGAFAITQDIIIIFAGLFIGALYVRSMTIYLVDHKILAKIKYLEHGAHYAIGFLAIMLFTKVFIEVPEWIIATGSIGIIVLSLAHSKLEQKQ